MTRLRVGVVGVGALGQHHARILAGLPDVELVGVADLREPVGRNVAERCRTAWFPDYRELFDLVDAATIVVPTESHLAVAGEFLLRRIPVMLEKPLALNADEGWQLVRISSKTNTLLQVGHIERFNPAWETARPLCGIPRYIRCERVSPFPFRSMDIGVVHDLMIHDLDLVLDLVGAPVAEVEALGVPVLSEREDAVQARVRFESGCVADFTASRTHPQASRNLQVWSASGCVAVDFLESKVTRYRPTEALLRGPSPAARAREPGADVAQLKNELFGTYLRVEQPAVEKRDALSAELREFVDCVRHGRPPRVSGVEALRALSVADRIVSSVAESLRQGSPVWQGAPSAVPLRPRKAG